MFPASLDVHLEVLAVLEPEKRADFALGRGVDPETGDGLWREPTRLEVIPVAVSEEGH
jgi:hypothetical protein